MRLFLSLVLLVPIAAQAQLTWSDGAAEMIFENCSVCHNPNGIGPFDLLTYDDVSNFSGAITEAVEEDYMPPWTADDEYSSFAHSRALELTEKMALLSWLADDMPVGNLADAPPAPVFENEGFIQEEANLEVEMAPHTSNATATQDDYICVSIPTGLTEDKVIRGFEVVPGNSSILHHCLVYIDETGNSQSDFSGFCGGPNNDQGLIGGYAPGTFPTVFPSNGDDINMGITLPAGSNIILALHYPHGSSGEVDQTKVKFYFYDEDVEVREFSTFPLIQNWNFNIEANTQEEVMASFGPTQQDYSIFSVFPHMHLVGEYIQAFAVSEDNVTIPLVKIPHWDFEWQEFYFFENLQHIPAGSMLYSNGTFNNTSSNPHNPNDPPQDIQPGLNTTDEMFLVYFHFVEYEKGDEDLDIENMVSLSTQELMVNTASSVNVYPNPASDEVMIDLGLLNSSKVSLYIYDHAGQLVEKVIDKQNLNQSEGRVIWNAETVSSGRYYYSALIDGQPASGAIVIR